MPGTRETTVMIAARAPGRRSSHHAPAIAAAAISIAAVALARRKSDSLMKTLSAVSDFAPKSCSTDENCGSTNRMKNSMTPTAATSTKTGYCMASVELAPHLFGSCPLRRQHLEHLIERARDFADPHQRDIHRRKQRRMIGHRIGKTLARAEARREACRPPDAIGRHRHRSANSSSASSRRAPAFSSSASHA